MQPRNFFKFLLMTALVSLALSLTALASDQKPASVLIYNYYQSDATQSAKSDTAFNLTNLNLNTPAFVHVIFVQSDSCAVADTFICLTPNQTATFFASDIDPGAKGYMVAVATDQNTGCPISFNHLIGSESVKWKGGRTASFNAEGFAALYSGTLPGCNANTPEANIDLNGTIYDAAPRSLAVDKIGSLADGNSTLVVVNSLNGNFSNRVAAIGPMFGVVYDDAEDGSSFAKSANCQLAEVLSDSFPMMSPLLFSAKISAGRTGWMYVQARAGTGITGAVISFNPKAETHKGAFNSSHNLHHRSYTTARMVIPVFAPTC
jgi:hypothetical protein